MKLSHAVAVLFGTCLLTLPAVAESPREFLSKALAGDNSEIMLGRLAADRGRSDEVRQYGRTLAEDHSTARDEVLQVGRRFGLRPNREPTSEARGEYSKLQTMHGREFDREFIDYMTDDHRKDIHEFREEAREGHGPTSALAQRQLPTLEKHLDIARGLDRAVRWNGHNRDNEHGRDRDYSQH